MLDVIENQKKSDIARSPFLTFYKNDFDEDLRLHR